MFGIYGFWLVTLVRSRFAVVVTSAILSLLMTSPVHARRMTTGQFLRGVWALETLSRPSPAEQIAAQRQALAFRRARQFPGGRWTPEPVKAKADAQRTVTPAAGNNTAAPPADVATKLSKPVEVDVSKLSEEERQIWKEIGVLAQPVRVRASAANVKGFRITALRHEGPATKEGWRVGDIVLSLTETTTPASLGPKQGQQAGTQALAHKHIFDYVILRDGTVVRGSLPLEVP